ncbi:MAG: nucleotidyltransferase [Eubacteriales bacterium]|nr:nucleotidyltransferase [Eubacteriales bacterium]MDY3332247.1 nucleotidyltransferase [Gallibacter sp.]
MVKDKKVLGIIAEYNPFHNGHLYHINEAKKISGADTVVVVMSGNFTQRGEPSIIDKYERTKMAIDNGVDLVVELPFYYACNSAQYFAEGGIEILESLGVVDYIAFGAETGDIDVLKKISNIVLEKNEILQRYLDKGLSYPAALEESLKEIVKVSEADFGNDFVDNYVNNSANSFINNSNDILAIEYLKALKKMDSSIIPITITRKGARHLDSNINAEFASGSAIRRYIKEFWQEMLDSQNNTLISATSNNVYKNMIENNKFGVQCELLKNVLPDLALEILKKNIDKLYLDEKKYYDILRAKLMTAKECELKRIYSISEGLENKFLSELRYSNTLDDYIKSVKSKRYTYTRINRICSQIIVNLTKDEKPPKYIRILGFNHKGRQLLKNIKGGGLNKLPIYTDVSQKEKDLMRHDITATDIYNLLSNNDIYEKSDFVVKPVIR